MRKTQRVLQKMKELLTTYLSGVSGKKSSMEKAFERDRERDEEGFTAGRGSLRTYAGDSMKVLREKQSVRL